MTVSMLLAQTKGIKIKGNELCFYCGEICNTDYHIKQYVKSTFTGRATVRNPKSEYICAGCQLAFQEKIIIEIDNQKRENQKMRGYSWVITEKYSNPHTKAHISILREICINPPLPPFAIILAESGQKHLIYRGIVNYDYQEVTISLEEEHITYKPNNLKERINVIKPSVAAIGKIAIKEELTQRIINSYWEYNRNDKIYDFLKVQFESLTRLAVWLSPNKKECQNECRKIDSGNIPEENSRIIERYSQPDLFA